MIGQLVNDELENIRKEAALSSSMYSASITLDLQIRPGAEMSIGQDYSLLGLCHSSIIRTAKSVILILQTVSGDQWRIMTVKSFAPRHANVAALL
jgi:hypothetical protein